MAMGGFAAEAGPPDCSGVDFEQDSDGYYEVETLSQLQCIEDEGLDHDYVLVEDIDASETEDWNEGDGFEPIGDSADNSWTEGNETVNGTFDGNGRTIANLTIDRDEADFVGLFGVIGSEGTVSDLTLESATVTGNDRVGGLSGQNWGTVSNLTLESATVTGNDDVGGLIGENRGTVSDVSTSTDVAGSGTIGGVIGNNFEGTITGATVKGAVFSKQDVGNPRVGGIVGYHHSSSSIDSSSFTNGTVDGENENIGGIAGYADGSPITNSSANGTIGNEDADSVGGLAGRHFGDLSDSYSTATVRGNDTVGGVIGDAVSSDIERTYAVGEVDGDGDDVGGLVGVGATGLGSHFNIQNSYWDTETTGVSKSFDSDEGEPVTDDEYGLTTDEMTGANAPKNMDGFGFPDGDDRWHAVEDDYPVLSYEDTDPVYGVEITSTNSAIDEGETLEVDATVTNLGSDGGEQSIELRDFDGDEVDTDEVTLESGEDIELRLEWGTEEDEGGLDDVTVASENDTDTRAVSVGAGDVIPQCQTIDTAGAYELTDGIETSDECIEIEADDVSLDGNDHTISGSGTGIVVNGHSNVTITNVTLSGLDVGIEMTDIEGATVEHTTVEESDESGLVFESVRDTTIANNTVEKSATSGIHLADATDTAIENNTLRENDENGMYVVDSEELVVSGNEVVDNGEDDEDELSHHVEDAGIYLSGTADSQIEANNLTANAQAALFLEESSTDNHILGNVVNVSVSGGSERWRGITIEESSGNVISDSVITSSEQVYLGEHGEDLIYVDSAETVVTDNKIYGHARVGIDIRGESNTVDNNSIAGSFHHSDTQNGHAIRVSGTGEDWSVTNNSLTNAEILNPERAGIAIIGDQTVEIQNNTGTKVDSDLSTDPGTDLELTHVEQFVENQQVTTPAGDTTVTFTGADLRLDGMDEQPATESPDDVESTGYYFRVDESGSQFGYMDLELAYNESDLQIDETVIPETFSLWRLDGGEWEQIEDSDVDADEQVVTGNVTEEGTIGVFGEQAFADGNGSADDPFIIEDWEHLDNVRLTPDSSFTLANDLDSGTDGYDDVAAASANDGDGFEPVGDDADQFEGTFDGDGHVIENLTVRGTDDAGLFGTVGGSDGTGQVRNVSVVNVSVSGDDRVGGIVGFNANGVVENANVHGDVSGGQGVGGLVGINDGELTHSYATGDVDGDESVGGLVGQNYQTVSESYATGSVNGSTAVGGLVGYNDGEVNESYATGSVECSQTCLGLIAFNDGDVADSYWDSETTGQDESAGSDDEYGLRTDEMTGTNPTEYMDGFSFPDGDGTWHATDSYPILAWEDTDPFFGVNITETNSPVDEGDVLAVTVDATNWGADGEGPIELLDVEGGEVDSEDVALESGDSDELSLEWETEVTDAGSGDVTVASQNETVTQAVTIEIHPILEDCRVIDQSGEYELGADIDASGTCIEITADDVTLDGNDHAINGGETGILVSGASIVTITNVTVTDSATDGIVLDGVDGATVENNTVTDSGRYGIYLEDSTDVVVSGNDLVDNGDGEYRELYPREDEVDGPADSGIALWGTTHSLVEANTMTGNDRFGISAVQSSHNEYLDNVVEVEGANSGGGIHLGAGSSDNTISGSTITVTSGTVSVDWDSNLIYVVTGENNVVTDNELDGERTRGIFIQLSSNAVVENNTIAGSYGHGIQIDQRDALAHPILGFYAATPGPATVANNSIEDVAVETRDFSSNEVGASGLYLYSDHAVETRNNTGTESGPDIQIGLSEQSVENQSISTSAGETTISFEGENLVLDGLEEPPNPERPDGLASTGYYVEIEDFVFENDRFDEFTGTYDASFENLELAYNETLLTTGDTIDPETLSLWQLDGEEWEEIDDSGVDTDEQVVTGNVMGSGTIGVFGEEPPLVDLDVDDVTIEQGEPLEVDLENAKDSIGDPYDDENEVTFEADAFDEPLSMNVTFDDGEASDVELLDADETAALSAATTTVEVDTAGQDQAAEFNFTVEPVFVDFDVADVAIDQGEPLEVDLENATDEAGDPFTGMVDLAGDDIDGQALSVDDVEFDDSGAVGGIELLDAQTTWGVSAGEYHDLTVEAVDTDVETTFDVTVEEVFADGDGSADDPFVIENWEHLDNVRNELDANFTLGADLDEQTDGYDDVASETANDGDGFDPIADFDGEFNGANNTIEDLYINRSDEDRVGLFASTEENAEIRDLQLENVDVTGEGGGPDDGVGSLVGFNEGDITNVSTTGDVYGDEAVGGLVGWNHYGGDMSESYATGNVSGDNRVGGLVGRTYGEVSESYATGNVEGEERVGGLVGENRGEVSESYSTGVVEADGDGYSHVGGLVGQNAWGDVSDSYWDVETTTQSTSAGSDDEYGLTTAEMTAINATENMEGFAFPDGDGTWHATDSYPALAWEDTDPFHEVTITDTTAPVEGGDSLEVTVSVTNWGADGEQPLTLTSESAAGNLAETDLRLDSGDSDEEVEMIWDTARSDAGAHTLTVSSPTDADTQSVTVDDPPPLPSPPAPADISVTEATLEEIELEEGESVTVNATLENDGGREGEQTISFYAAGDEFATETVTLDSGSTTTVTANETFDESGEYEISVGDVTAGTVSVEAERSEFTIIDVDRAFATLDPGEEERVVVTVANDGEGVSDADVTLDLEGEAQSQTLEVDAGSADGVEFSLTAPDEEGEYEYTISVGGEETTETVVVESPEPSDSDASNSTFTPQEADDDGDGQPGFGILVTLASLALLLLIATRFRRP
ncbi:hypothetical protein GCM10025298_23720 [Natronobiforma cellulositropha]